MASITELSPGIKPKSVAWLELLSSDWQLIADLSFADLILWVPAKKGFVAAGQARPSSAATLFYRDITGQAPRNDWLPLIESAFQSSEISQLSGSAEYEGSPTRLAAIPVIAGSGKPIAVITRHNNLSDAKMPNKLQLNYLACSQELLSMIAGGDFPNMDSGTGPKRGAPRANDGLIRLDSKGRVTFASPNALSAFHAVGVEGELEGEVLAEVATRNNESLTTVDEGLPMVLSGKDYWRADLTTRKQTLSIRSIPLKTAGIRTGGIVLCRDVTQLRDRERELITKDVTIREIHHRVKNNLQTVSSLLRIQSRLSDSEEVKSSLNQAMRRVNAISLVHDALSEGIEQAVVFDDIFSRILKLVSELFAGYQSTVTTKIDGKFGSLPGERATALALALTEIVTNAVEHGLIGRSGNVDVVVKRAKGRLEIQVTDDGVGLPEGKVGSGLGTQIIRSLVEGELKGSISWTAPIRGGTRVTVSIPV